MNGIQVVLLIGIGLISFIFIRKSRGKGFNIFFLVVAALVSAVFVIRPDLTTKIARLLGVGRGTDFVVYISIMVFWYFIVQLFARIRRLEQMMTEILRKDAIHSATVIPINEPGDGV